MIGTFVTTIANKFRDLRLAHKRYGLFQLLNGVLGSLGFATCFVLFLFVEDFNRRALAPHPTGGGRISRPVSKTFFENVFLVKFVK